MKLSLSDVHHIHRGPFTCPEWLAPLLGDRERRVLAARDAGSYPHRLNRDVDEYINDDCITYFTHTQGQFTINKKTRQIVG